MQLCTEQKKTTLEQLSENLGYFYKNGWDALFDNGMAIQDAVLADILAMAKDSAYAKENGFANVQTKEEFLQKAPISDYNDYRPYICDNLKNDAGQLTAQETVYYLLSTGMSNQGKYYPETRLGALARQLNIDIWNMMVMQTVPTVNPTNMKLMAVMTCLPLDQAENGIVVRRTSGQAAKELWERHPQFYVYPYEFLEAQLPEDDKDYMAALYVLKEKKFNKLCCNNMAYFGNILDWIEKRPNTMIQDIRTGTMSVNLPIETWEQLAPSFEADPARADELQALLDEYGKLPLEKVWPDFAFVGTWMSGTAGMLAKAVRRRLPASVKWIAESYGASEGMFTLPREFDNAAGPLASFVGYFEFLPLDQSSGPVNMTEVEIGKYYELIVTTYSGLYRYNLHDIVRVDGFTGDTANVEFVCRSSDILELRNQRLYGFEFLELMEQVQNDSQCPMTIYQAYVEDGALSVIVQPDHAECNGEGLYASLQRITASKGIPLGNLYLMDKQYCATLFKSFTQFGRTTQTIKLPLIMKRKPFEELVKQIYHAES
ncbi:MAG: GH3 auxin-responsive promoter family protein [Peptococcaceae bacterium]|nr:GH3 auxin-responsive promoter family protein [Peptococcaceae bacterium]